jgi:hypothetical protein
MNKFVETLMNTERGKVANECDASLTEIVRSIRERGGKGSLTLTFSLKMAGSGENAMELTAMVKKVLPDRGRMSSIFYANKDNTLQRNDPNQEELRLAEVKGGTHDGATVAVPKAAAPVTA